MSEWQVTSCCWNNKSTRSQQINRSWENNEHGLFIISLTSVESSKILDQCLEYSHMARDSSDITIHEGLSYSKLQKFKSTLFFFVPILNM